MTKSLVFILALLWLLACTSTREQTAEVPAGSRVAMDTTAYTFPDDWLGVWKGTLTLQSLARPGKRTIATELHITETDTANQWTWTIVYIDTTRDIQDERKYILVAKDSSLTHFIVDEKNSIYLDQYLIGNNMVSRFAVNNSLLFANYHLRGDRIESEIFSGKMDEPVVTGTELPDSSGVEKVLSYPVGFMQRAVLFRD